MDECYKQILVKLVWKPKREDCRRWFIIVYDQCDTSFILSVEVLYLSKTFKDMRSLIIYGLMIHASPIFIMSVIRLKGKFQNGCYKKTKHAKFSEKRKFLTSWYAHVHVHIRG